MNATAIQSDTVTVEVGGFELTVRDVRPSDEASVLALHQRVFGPGATAGWFAWKYGTGPHQGHSEAVGVWHDGALIAHCAGIPRTLWRSGVQTRGLQIGDVMVDPSWRGILTRRGPFFHASQRLYASRLGPVGQRPFQLGFGFPNERHMRLAVKSHLAWDGGRLHELRWSTQPAASSVRLGWGWHWDALTRADADLLEDVDRAWLAMRDEGGARTLGQRDRHYVTWRYLNRPNQKYHLFRLRRAWPSRTVGIAVLKLQCPQSQWLDWIGPSSWLTPACRASQLEAARFGAHELGAWASPMVVDALQGSKWQHNAVTACLGLPAASDLTESEVKELDWWLMGGDTDFL